MDLLAKEIETSGVMRPMKGNYLAFVLRSGRAKKKKKKEGGGIKHLCGGCTKKQGLFTFDSTFETKMDFNGEGPKLFLC